MNDLTKTRSIPLSTVNGEVESSGGSFTDRLRARLGSSGASSQGRLPASSALLLDVSGSMGSFCGANKRAIDQLSELAQNFTNVRRFEFSSDCKELKPTDKIREPDSGTSMHLAFMVLKSAGVSHCVLITDGQPDSASLALQEAKGLKIDVFYVGPDPAPPFLAQLAQKTGGQYGKASLNQRPALESKVRALLTDGTSGGKGPIVL